MNGSHENLLSTGEPNRGVFRSEFLDFIEVAVANRSASITPFPHTISSLPSIVLCAIESLIAQHFTASEACYVIPAIPKNCTSKALRPQNGTIFHQISLDFSELANSRSDQEPNQKHAIIVGY